MRKDIKDLLKIRELHLLFR